MSDILDQYNQGVAEMERDGLIQSIQTENKTIYSYKGDRVIARILDLKSLQFWKPQKPVQIELLEAALVFARQELAATPIFLTMGKDSVLSGFSQVRQTLSVFGNGQINIVGFDQSLLDDHSDFLRFVLGHEIGHGSLQSVCYHVGNNVQSDPEHMANIELIADWFGFKFCLDPDWMAKQLGQEGDRLKGKALIAKINQKLGFQS